MRLKDYIQSDSGQLITTLATGTAPLAVSSTTKVANLNVDKIDDLDSNDFMRIILGNGGYYGMAGPGGIDNIYIRTTTAGILPHSCGGSLSAGRGNIGTSAWPFSEIWSQRTQSQWVNANRQGLGSDGGLTLYAGSSNYMIALRNNWGKLPNSNNTFGITDSWSMFFTMNDNTSRGWIFRRGSTNVAGINGYGTYLSSVNTGSYLAGNQGKAIIDSTVGPGSYTMLFRQKSSNGVFTGGVYIGDWELHYTDNATITNGTNTISHSIQLLDEYGITKLKRLYIANTNITGENTDNISGYSLYTQGNANINGTLYIRPTTSSYREGIRIYSFNNWSDITLLGSDSPGDSGITTNSWFIGNNNGNFYLTRNGSTGGSARLSCVSNHWFFSGDTTFNNNIFVNGTSTFTGDLFYTNGSYNTMRFLHFFSGDNNGSGVAIGAGGAVVVGGGESATNLISNLSLGGSNETTYITSDNNIYFYTACQTIANKKGVGLDTALNFYPLVNNTGSLGTSSYRWGNAYINNLNVSGSTTMAGSLRLQNGNYNGNLKINFGDGDYVYLREPWDDGLEIKANEIRIATSSHGVYIGGTENLGVEPTYSEKLYVNGNTRIAGELYVNNWVRTFGNTGWYNETYGGGWYMQDTTWIYAYGNKSVYTWGTIRSDSWLQVGNNGANFYANNSGNGYFSNTLGIGGTHTGFNLYVNGTAFIRSGIGIGASGYDPAYKLYVTGGPSYLGGSTKISGTLRIYPTETNFCEGIRIQPFNYWSDITLLGSDSPGDSGITANSWFIGNNNGFFYITRAGSTSGTVQLACTNNQWQIKGSAVFSNNVYFTNLYVSGETNLFKSFYCNNGTTAGPHLGIQIATTTRGITLPTASTSRSGVVTTGAQTFAGIKTFYNGIRLQNGNYNTDVKLNFGDGDYVYLREPWDDGLEIKANEIRIATSSCVCIGDTSNLGSKPTYPEKLYVLGRTTISGDMYVSQGIGIGGLNTSYKLYVNGISYFTERVGIGVAPAGFSSSRLIVSGGTALFASGVIVGTGVRGVTTSKISFCEGNNVYLNEPQDNYLQIKARRGVNIVSPYLYIGASEYTDTAGTATYPTTSYKLYVNGTSYFTGNVRANACLGVGGLNTSYKLYVNGVAKITSRLSVGNYDHGGYVLATQNFICNGSVDTIGNTGWYNATYYGGWYMSDSTWIRAYNNKSVYTGGTIQAGRVQGAVWNDYAEYRRARHQVEIQPGRVVIENGDDTVSVASKRLEPGGMIVSDTFGFAIGQIENICETPIAVSGRVLAYPYENRYSYQPGDAVCTGPNGTVSKMTREEIKEYPERIIGIVSAVPDYAFWGTDNVPINGRIWIRVR